MPRVGIVADSTSDLGPEWFAAHGVEMVPLVVRFGDEQFRDWVDLTPDEFYAKQRKSTVLAKTSQPSPADFTAVYERLAAEGATEIVVVTLSAALSGTYESATLAAADPPVPVRVVDTRLASQATGLVVKAAARARDAGGSAAEVEAAAQTAAANAHLYFVLDTMEYLVKGGRAGRAAGLAASLLNIKPVLHLGSDGVIEPYRKVKGMKNAIQAIAERVAEDSAEEPVCLVFLSGSRPEFLEAMRTALDKAGARYEVESSGKVGAVIAAYTGGDVVGVAYHPARDA